MAANIVTAEKIIEVLPQILEKEPEIKYKLFAIIEEKFPTREETNRILEEIKKLREDFNQRFEKNDKRFEKMDKRFERMDKRFEKIDKRFERMDKRFEKIDKRFEKIDKRFEKVDERFKEMRLDMDKRFEKVDERFEQIRLDMNNHRDFVNIVVGGFQTRAGRNLENTIAGTLRFALKTNDIKPENLKLRQKIKDDQGLIGKKGRKYEYDILASNNKYLIFEIKSTPDTEDIERFADKCDLVIKKLKLNKKKVEKVLVTLEKSQRISEDCKANSITLV